jgi:hypothetical protein
MQSSSKPDDFLPQRAYPVEASAAERSPRTTGGSFTRYALPVVLFVAIVGLIAWMVQSMPKWKTGVTTQPDGQIVEIESPLVFTRLRAQWERPLEAQYVYLSPLLTGSLAGHGLFMATAALAHVEFSPRHDLPRETEKGVRGHYDFPFKNTSTDQAVELGLLRPSCDCVSIEACVLPRSEWERIDWALSQNPGVPAPYSSEPSWQALASMESSPTVLTVPADGRGVVRVKWSGNKSAGTALNLTPTLWCQFQGKPGQRSSKDMSLTVPIVIASALHYTPSVAGVGTLTRKGEGRVHFYFWTTTREQLDLKLAPSTDPFFDVKLRPLAPSEFADLALYADKEVKRAEDIKAGYKATVTVYEQKDGKEMPLGPFTKELPVLLDELQHSGPSVFGMVRGEVEVASREPGRITLETFSVKQGMRATFYLFTDGQAKLELERTPTDMQVKLTRLDKDSTPQRGKWRLEVAIPAAGIEPGVINDTILLRLLSTPPRQVRIPVGGHALAN